jgi:hypothetical protein
VEEWGVEEAAEALLFGVIEQDGVALEDGVDGQFEIIEIIPDGQARGCIGCGGYIGRRHGVTVAGIVEA